MPRYEPDAPAQAIDARDVQRFLLQELRKISSTFRLTDEGQHDVLHAAPTKPREGQIVVADGVDWNPGNGSGAYVYINGVWAFLGGSGGDIPGFDKLVTEVFT